jgi:hypothetical protein
MTIGSLSAEKLHKLDRIQGGRMKNGDVSKNAVCMLLWGTFCFLWAGYGDPDADYPGLPSWQERTVIVLTNACRMDPVGYRDAHLGAPSILLPSNYPPVAPLRWNLALNRVARIHAEDMANNCGMQHNSCDGTNTFVRIKKYYDGDGLAENIAVGQRSPQAVVRTWLLDDWGSGPVPDNTPEPMGDGHRKNIMNGAYKEKGTGFAIGPVGRRDENPYWVQDFGGNHSAWSDRPVAAGSHLFWESSTITFAANFYDDAAPGKAEVIIDGQAHSLSVDLGEANAGTYTVDLPTAGQCRSYFFRFVDNRGESWRYPEKGALITYGEGGCDQAYSDNAPVQRAFRKVIDQTHFSLVIRNGWVTAGPFAQKLERIEIIDAFGRKLLALNKREKHGSSVVCDISGLPHTGRYFFRALFVDGAEANRIFLLKAN